jgi:GNAT superfamily N-acetyltransferase
MPEPLVAIRRATLADAPALSSLIKSVAHFCTVHPDGCDAERFFAGTAPAAIESFIASPAYHYLVGELDGQLAGAVALRDNSHLFHLFVPESLHRRGIAGQLWRHVKAHALANGNPGVFTVNASMPAVPVYQHFGFVTVTEPVVEDGIRYVRMRYPAAAT